MQEHNSYQKLVFSLNSSYPLFYIVNIASLRGRMQ